MFDESRTRIAALLALGSLLVAGALAIESRAEDRAEAARPDPEATTPELTGHQAHVVSLIERKLTPTALGSEWIDQAQRSLSAPLPVRSPYVEEGRFVRRHGDATGYRVHVERGQRLEARVEGGLVRSGDLLVDLFRVADDSSGAPIRVRSLSPPQGALDFEPDADGDFVLRLQPKLFSAGTYRLTLRVVPLLLFPVEGRTNSAVWSGFGAPREAGRRAHHGIDIFADRGTPALAATDAYVRRVDVTPVGGKVVWLRDRTHGLSLYYAHLDSQLVRTGQTVSRGDTVGFVGNTGNARTTPTHLHFGVYVRHRGPIDPFPFVRIVDTEPSPVGADPSLAGERAEPRSAGARLRTRPSRSGRVVDRIGPDQPVRVMAATGNWYRVRLQSGQEGYLAAGEARRPYPASGAADGEASSQPARAPAAR